MIAVRRLACVFAMLAMAACLSLERSGGSRASVNAWAQPKGFAEVSLASESLRFFGLMRQAPIATRSLTIYIEGDGAAWPTPSHPPRDPTPWKPVALQLAALDPAPAVAYLGRPCQYLDAAALAQCPSAYWMEKRFAPEVIEASDAAVTKLKTLSGAQTIRLVGYSGGGVVAALLAARRNDVEAFVTVAAPLALSKWTQWHEATPMTGSLDPAELPGAPMSGVHLAGGEDEVVPAAILEEYVRVRGGQLFVVADFDHVCCWSRDWARLLQQTIAPQMK